MQHFEPVSKTEFAIGLLRNLPNILLYLVMKVAEKFHLMGWIYPQLKNQPDLPKLVNTLESEVRKAHIPAHCVLVDVENPFIFFHLRPLIRTTKRNFDLVVKKLIYHQVLPVNTFVRKKDNLFILLIDKNWIADNFPTA